MTFMLLARSALGCGLLLPVAAALASNAVETPSPAHLSPAPESNIATIEQTLALRQYSVSDLERYFASRIGQLDQQRPALHSIIELNPEAISLAASLDAQLQARNSHPRGHKNKGARMAQGALFGIPILLKDNIDTDDQLHTTAGSLALVDSRPPQDAFIVKRLRAAGALILGKTNMSEWANFRSSHSTSGWSGRGGQTHNPYDVARNPCGSSSGSGAAVAADLATVAIGTETDGSVVCPSSANGLVGIKPTVGLISRSGIIPISASQDTAGPIARTVEDAVTLLNVIAGYDPDDPATARLKDLPPPDFRQALRADSLKGARVGVLREYAGFQEGTDALFEQAIEKLRSLGAVIVDPVSIPTKGKFSDDEQTVLLYEFKDGINRYLATRRGESPRDLAGLIAFNQAHAETEMPWFGQDQFLQSQQKGPLTDPAYQQAHERARRLAGAEGIDAALMKDHLDVLIAPTGGPAWMTDLVNGDHSGGGDISSPPAVAGYPHITVPMGLVHGLPVGLSFVGTAWSEAKLIGYAYAFEQATHAHKPPTLPDADR
jgi:amidase